MNRFDPVAGLRPRWPHVNMPAENELRRRRRYVQVWLATLQERPMITETAMNEGEFLHYLNWMNKVGRGWKFYAV